MKNQVYVVVSDTIAHGQTFHGIHGVYTSKDSAQISAISAITSIAQHHGYNITKNDIAIEYEDYIYANDKIDIVVSCIEQQLL